MKNATPSPSPVFIARIAKLVVKAFKSVFTSPSKNDYVRLKNFISS